jgi:hypothetical protein
MNPLRGISKAPVPAIVKALAAALCLLAARCAAPEAPPPAPGPETPAAAKPPAERSAAAEKPGPARAAAGDRELFSPRRTVEVPVEARKTVRSRSVELWTSADGGQTWVNQGAADASRGSVSYLAPRDGRFGVILVPMAPDGAREFTPKPGDAPEKALVVDTALPVVELLAPNGGEILGAHRTTVVRWTARDTNMDPAGITLEASTDGEAWIPVARDLPNTGSYHWDIGPLSSAQFRLRVSARDLAGNVGSDVSDAAFVVDGLSPDCRITGPLGSRDLPARLEWTGGDLGGSGLKRVSLYVTRDNGQTWQFHGNDDDLQPPFPFKELDGIYGLRLVAEDAVGNVNPTPTAGSKPQFTVVIDRTKPEVKLISPKAGGYLGGAAVDVQWSARDNVEMPPAPISLAWSDDGGRTWKDVARGLKNDGLSSWTPPVVQGTDFRFRVTAVDFAGNEGQAVSDRFGIDASVPEAVATGPDRSNSNTVQIGYEIRNRGTAPITNVMLYYRPEGAREWLEYGKDSDHETPFLFAKAEGRYGIIITGATESGLKSGLARKAPGPDAVPQLMLTIDSTPPLLTLETMNGGGFFMGGAMASVIWKITEPNPDLAGLSIYHTPDGGFNWNVVATGLDPTKGKYSWVVPKVSGSRHRLRLTALDKFGNTGQVESERPFTIDDEPPTVMVVRKPNENLRGSKIAVDYRAADLISGIDRVELYGRPMGTEIPYRQVYGTKNAQGTIDAEVPGEGRWGFFLVAVDAAGHWSAEPGRNPKPDFECVLDFTRPTIALRKSMLARGGHTWLNPAWEIEWKAEDRMSGDKLGIRIEISPDGGKTWHVVAANHANSGKADMRNHLIPGRKYRVHVVAFDPAGNEGEDVTDDFDPGDVPPPALTLKGIEDGKSYPAGGRVTISWSSTDKSIRSILLELSEDGGRTWTALSEMRIASMAFPIPDKAKRYYLRGTATDTLNRPVSSNYVIFDAVSALDQVRIVTSPSVESSRLVRVLVEPKSAMSGVKAAQLEIFEGKDWRAVSDVKGADFNVPAPAAPGEYAVRLVITSADGRDFTSNEARFRVTAGKGGDTASVSGVRLLNFQKGGVYAGGRPQLIMVRSELKPADLRVEISDAGGREGSWKEVPRDQLRAEKDLFQWRVPAVTGNGYRLRVGYRDAAGKWVGDQSAVDFAIDSRPPSATVVGPRGEVPAPVKLEVRLEPSISPVSQIVVYGTQDGGKTWLQHDVCDAASGAVFRPRTAGDHGLYVVARSEAGLAGAPPTPGTPPQATIRVVGKVEPLPADAAAGLTRNLEETVRGGTKVSLTWSFKEAGPVTVSLLIGERDRRLIAKDQPARGQCVWEVPMENLADCRILMEQGERVEKSRKFDIDSTPPQIQDVDVEVPRK